MVEYFTEHIRPNLITIIKEGTMKVVLRSVKIFALICLAVSFTHAARIPIPAGFPNANTTGINGAGLNVSQLRSSGPLEITTPGTVIELMNISGGVKIMAANVTIRKCNITGGTYGVRATYGFKNTLVEDCTISQGYSKGINGGNITVRRCDISGYEDGVYVSSNTLIEDSYIHDLLLRTGSHNDGMQSQAGKNVVVRHTTIQAFYLDQTSCMIWQTNFGPIDNILFENNFLSGGRVIMYFRDKGTGYGLPTNIRILNNVIEKGSFVSQIYSLDGPTTQNCNRYHTGDPIGPQSNCQSSGGVASATILPNGGNFDGSTTVSINSSTANATIYYTTDGSTPDQSSMLYTAPITLTSSVTLKAVAFKDGLNPSWATTATFTNTAGMVFIEAEKMQLSGYSIDQAALQGEGIVITDKTTVPLTASATTNFTGSSGTYSIELIVSLEDDAQSQITLFVGGQKVINETYPLGKNQTRYTYTVTGISVSKGAEIRIEGTSGGTPSLGAFARVDKLIFTQEGALGIEDDHSTKLRAGFGLNIRSLLGSNPARGVVQFNLPSLSAGLTIYDGAGNVVHSVWTGRGPSIRWNGTDLSGNLVTPGLYFYQIKTKNEIINGKFTKIK